MRPPLVREFMRPDVGDVVDLGRVGEVGDEAKPLAPGKGVGEGLGEAGIVRIFDDPGLTELIGAEGRLEIVERFFQRGQHPIHIVGAGVMVDFEGHPVMNPTGNLIAGRLNREEQQDRGLGDEPGRPAVTGHCV